MAAVVPPLLRRILCAALDLAGILTVVSLGLVVIGGGGRFEVGRFRLSATSTTNPAFLLYILIVIRLWLRADAAFVGVRSWSLTAFAARSRAQLEWITSRLDAQSRAGVRTIVIGVAVLAVAVKVVSAWLFPGFFSGDDVEIHEMTLSARHGFDWDIWTLRNAFFPFAFVYPAQALADAMGIDDPRGLVTAGRVAVAICSTCVIPLTYAAARRVAPQHRGVAIIAAVLVGLNELQISFGSTELPRPVATVFVLLAFVVLLRHGPASAAAAGVLLGIAATFRFSELIFLAPAALMLLVLKRRFDLLMLFAGAACGAAAAIGVADYLYWGRPFASLVEAWNYTVVERASSRGFEPLYQYFGLLPYWTNLPVFALAVIGSFSSLSVALWAWLPVLILSALPHKETRYLIPVIPFVSMAAAIGLYRAVALIRSVPPRRAEFIAAAVGPLLAVGLLEDTGGWRLPRSNEEVRLALWLGTVEPGGLAMRQLWRAGNRIYLGNDRLLVEIEDRRLLTPADRFDLLKDVRWVVIDRQTAGRIAVEELTALGFTAEDRWRGETLQLYVRVD